MTEQTIASKIADKLENGTTTGGTKKEWKPALAFLNQTISLPVMNEAGESEMKAFTIETTVGLGNGMNSKEGLDELLMAISAAHTAAEMKKAEEAGIEIDPATIKPFVFDIKGTVRLNQPKAKVATTSIDLAAMGIA